MWVCVFILFIVLQENKETIEKKLKVLFRYSISVKPPEDNVRLVSWKSQVEEDMKAIQAQDNRNRIIEVAVNAGCCCVCRMLLICVCTEEGFNHLCVIDDSYIMSMTFDLPL